MVKDIFQRMTAAEFKAIKPIKNLVFVNGVAVNSEDDLCIACVDWFDRMFGEQRKYDLIHIPNEGKRTRWEGKRMQRMGLRAGTPDYLVQKDGQPVGWIEFKFGKNKLSPSQKSFKDYVEKSGVKFATVWTFEEFKAVLKAWGITPPKKESECRTSPLLLNIFK